MNGEPAVPPTTPLLPESARRHATDHSDSLAVVEDGLRWTWGDLNARADGVALGLASGGIRPAMRVALLVAILLGAPVFTAIGGAALILFWSAGSPIAAIVLKHYSLVTNPTLPTIPLFTLAGFFLAAGGASRRGWPGQARP